MLRAHYGEQIETSEGSGPVLVEAIHDKTHGPLKTNN
jgi:hypothetical protein